MPEGWELYPESVIGDARDVVKNEEEAPYHVEVDVEEIKERAREEMWYELLDYFMFEGERIPFNKDLAGRNE